VAGTSVASAADNSLADGAPGTTVLELSCQVTQSGFDFSALGFVTQVNGASSADLFTDPAQRDVGHARLVISATGLLVARSVDDAKIVHALDIDGELRIVSRPSGGASFSDPSSFTSGPLVARYQLQLQDVLTVIAPRTGLPALNGAAKQLDVGTVGGRRFGRQGLALRFVANGFGTRAATDTDANPQATLSIAGSMIAA
jgi:hypothetical protein